MHKESPLPSIIFTIGPSTQNEDTLRSIFAHPVSYVRFNMSHASHEEHRARLALVRKIAEELGKKIGVFADLCGPKIRILPFQGDVVSLSNHDTLTIVTHDIDPSVKRIATSYHDLYKYVTPLTQIACDDGKIIMRVMRVEDTDIVCEVVQGGPLLSEKGVNILNTDFPIEAFTDKDRADALFAIKEGFDGIALSFVKKADDVIVLKNFLKEHGAESMFVISKIETKEALHTIDTILNVTDMVMVARGDLGIEIPREEIPRAQKDLLYLAHHKDIPTIVATEMLKSMVDNPYPSRAELTDCMSALIDGASYIMLSDETTIGAHPKEAVHVMADAINEFLTHRASYDRFTVI